MDAATMSVLSISAAPFRPMERETHGATSTISAPVHLNFSRIGARSIIGISGDSPLGSGVPVADAYFSSMASISKLT